mmetsp:Transcript_2263/g.3421  ORF Transcript_2263/g.3421 Transcript_2263/m.3421 type:complete len:234 (-) Transcript_2263:2917-3618(-)
MVVLRAVVLCHERQVVLFLVAWGGLLFLLGRRLLLEELLARVNCLPVVRQVLSVDLRKHDSHLANVPYVAELVPEEEGAHLSSKVGEVEVELLRVIALSVVIQDVLVLLIINCPELAKAEVGVAIQALVLAPELNQVVAVDSQHLLFSEQNEQSLPCSLLEVELELRSHLVQHLLVATDAEEHLAHLRRERLHNEFSSQVDALGVEEGFKVASVVREIEGRKGDLVAESRVES